MLKSDLSPNQTSQPAHQRPRLNDAGPSVHAWTSPSGTSPGAGLRVASLAVRLVAASVTSCNCYPPGPLIGFQTDRCDQIQSDQGHQCIQSNPIKGHP